MISVRRCDDNSIICEIEVCRYTVRSALHSGVVRDNRIIMFCKLLDFFIFSSHRTHPAVIKNKIRKGIVTSFFILFYETRQKRGGCDVCAVAEKTSARLADVA